MGWERAKKSRVDDPWWNGFLGQRRFDGVFAGGRRCGLDLILASFVGGQHAQLGGEMQKKPGLFAFMRRVEEGHSLA